MSKPSEELTSKLYEVLKSHYIALYTEDRFFKLIREKLIREELRKLDEKWAETVYAETNEPTRIGYVKALIHDIHRVVYGDFDVPSLELTWHGHVRERVSKEEDLSTGIDIVYLIRYPVGDGGQTRESIVLPLFIAAKSSEEAFEEVKVKEIVQKRLNLVKEHKGTDIEKIGRAMTRIPDFVRGVITRTSREQLNGGKCSIERDIERDRVKIYTDIVCGALNIVLHDIPEIYKRIVEDQDLRTLDFSIWIAALLLISQRLDTVTILTSSKPPETDNRGLIDIIEGVMKKLHEYIADFHITMGVKETVAEAVEGVKAVKVPYLYEGTSEGVRREAEEAKKRRQPQRQAVSA